jgi:hypothetical protein
MKYIENIEDVCILVGAIDIQIKHASPMDSM